MIRFSRGVAISFFLLCLWAVPSAQAFESVPCPRSEILKLVDAQAQTLNLDVENMSVSFDAYNTAWNDFNKNRVANNPDSLSPIQIGPQTKTPQDVLDKGGKPQLGEEFWAVYYGPLRPMLDGDLWVFVDRNYCKVFDYKQW